VDVREQLRQYQETARQLKEELDGLNTQHRALQDECQAAEQVVSGIKVINVAR
jgi:prefoldin subunit 5